MTYSSRFWFAMALLLPLLTLFVCPESQAADWPQWLGPDRNGKSTETQLLSGWQEKKEPPVLWKIALGAGFSGLSVVGDKLFTMTSDPLSVDKAREYVVAYSARLGRPLWRKAIGPVYKDGQGGNGPRSTPTVAKDRVYALSGQGNLMALKAENGSVLWMTNLQQNFGAKVPTWGFSSSPLVVRDTLFLDAGGSMGHALIALNIHNGAVRWHTGSYEVGYSSPILATPGGVPQILFFPADFLVSVAPATGRVLWEIPWETRYDVNAATPLFLPPDKVFISTAYGTGAGLFQVTATAGGVIAKPIWKAKTMRNKMATSVVHGEYIYGFDEAALTCIRADNGSRVWSQDGFGRGTLIYVDQYLLVLGDEGRFSMVRATPEGYRPVGTMQALAETCWTVPSFANGVVYLRDTAQMMAIDLRKR